MLHLWIQVSPLSWNSFINGTPIQCIVRYTSTSLFSAHCHQIYQQRTFAMVDRYFSIFIIILWHCPHLSSGAMANVTMCPICDQFCQFWSLGDACMMTKAKYFFDNETTVVFALFMSLWSIIFTELWKRYSAEITHRWDVFGYDPEEEHPRPEYLAQLKDVKVNITNKIYHTVNCLRSFLSLSHLVIWSLSHKSLFLYFQRCD